jgi:hypothetical protein
METGKSEIRMDGAERKNKKIDLSRGRKEAHPNTGCVRHCLTSRNES